MEAVLITLGYRVLACSDGDEALRCAALYSDELDLLVTDLVMPRVGGLELAQKMLADRPEMPILLISGFSHDKRAIEELLASRSDIGFLRKPFKLSELERTLRALGGPASSPPTSQA